MYGLVAAQQQVLDSTRKEKGAVRPLHTLRIRVDAEVDPCEESDHKQTEKRCGGGGILEKIRDTHLTWLMTLVDL